MLTRIKAGPVAHGGIPAKNGEKNTAARKHNPVTIAAIPVRPPDSAPAPLSTNAVTGDDPKRADIEIQKALVQYAMVEPGKSGSGPVSLPVYLANP